MTTGSPELDSLIDSIQEGHLYLFYGTNRAILNGLDFHLLYNSKMLVIILLATVALTLMGPAVSGISLQQQAKAETSGQNGKGGTIDSATSPDCNRTPPSMPKCTVFGGKGGVGNVQNEGMSFNGNGGDPTKLNT